jgi:hypothetical protein
VSRFTVAEYLRRAGVRGITWLVPTELDDAALERKLFTPPFAAGEFSRGHCQVGRRLGEWQGVGYELAPQSLSWFPVPGGDYRARGLAVSLLQSQPARCRADPGGLGRDRQL